MTAELGRQGWQVNEKGVRRVIKQMGIKGKMGQVKVTTTNSSHNLPRYPNLIRSVTAAYPNHVWVAHITYIRLVDRFIYLAVVLDVAKSLSHTLSVETLKQVLRKGTSVLHHSDQGVQYAAKGYIELLTQNAFAERFMHIFKEEHVDYSDYPDFADARQQIGHWIEAVYMQQRIHSVLQYLTPAEFEAAYVGTTQSVTLNC